MNIIVDTEEDNRDQVDDEDIIEWFHEYWYSYYGGYVVLLSILFELTDIDILLIEKDRDGVWIL
jgi:hypothetical protein